MCHSSRPTTVPTLLSPQIGDRWAGRPRAVDPNSGAAGGGVLKARTPDRGRDELTGGEATLVLAWFRPDMCELHNKEARPSSSNEGPKSPPSCAGRRGGMPPGRVAPNGGTRSQGGAVQIGCGRADCDTNNAASIKEARVDHIEGGACVTFDSRRCAAAQLNLKAEPARCWGYRKI